MARGTSARPPRDSDGQEQVVWIVPANGAAPFQLGFGLGEVPLVQRVFCCREVFLGPKVSADEVPADDHNDSDAKHH